MSLPPSAWKLVGVWYSQCPSTGLYGIYGVDFTYGKYSAYGRAIYATDVNVSFDIRYHSEVSYKYVLGEITDLTDPNDFHEVSVKQPQDINAVLRNIGLPVISASEVDTSSVLFNRSCPLEEGEEPEEEYQYQDDEMVFVDGAERFHLSGSLVEKKQQVLEHAMNLIQTFMG